MKKTPDSDNFDALRLSKQLCFALYAATHAITRAYRPLLANLGITYPQYLVLLVLWETDRVPVGEIARRLQLDAAALTPLVKRLDALTLIARERDQQDERIVRICLTQKGQDLKLQAVGVQSDMACKVSLEGDKLYRLREQLHQLVEELNPEPFSEA